MPKEQKPNQKGFYLSIQIPIEWKLGKSGCVLDVSDKSRQQYIRFANATGKIHPGKFSVKLTSPKYPLQNMQGKATHIPGLV